MNEVTISATATELSALPFFIEGIVQKANKLYNGRIYPSIMPQYYRNVLKKLLKEAKEENASNT